MNRTTLSVVTLLAAMLLALSAAEASGGGRLALLGVAALYALVFFSLWRRLGHPSGGYREAAYLLDLSSPSGSPPVTLLPTDAGGDGQSPFWVRATQLIFRNVLLHVADLGGGAGVQLSAAVEYLNGTPDTTALDAAFSASHDGEIKRSWELLRGVNGVVLERMLNVIRIKAAMLPDGFIERAAVGEFAAQVQF